MQESLLTRFESIIHREFEKGHHFVEISGTTSVSASALFLSNISSNKIKSLPHLVITSSVAEANKFAQGLSAFDSKIQSTILPHFDVSPYLGLIPRPQALAERIRFLWQAQNAKPNQIFISPIGSLLQKTLPYQVLSKNITSFKLSDDLPSDIASFLNKLGYQSAPLVEDLGQFSQRGGILDIFSPAHDFPIRIELFGDAIESIRFFNPIDQSSIENTSSFTIIPTKEVVWGEFDTEAFIEKFRASLENREFDRSEFEEALRSALKETHFDGIDFLLPYIYENLDMVVDHFSSDLNIWLIDKNEIIRHSDEIYSELLEDSKKSTLNLAHPPVESLYLKFENLNFTKDSFHFEFVDIESTQLAKTNHAISKINYNTFTLQELSQSLSALNIGTDLWLNTFQKKLRAWKDDQYKIFIFVKNKTLLERVSLLIEKTNFIANKIESDDSFWIKWCEEQLLEQNKIHILQRDIPYGVRLPEEKLILIKDEDILGKKLRISQASASENFQKKAKRLSFGDLKPGDLIVHVQHGIGVYEGLKIISIGGIDNEFLELQYKDKDKLFLPVYRVGQLQKYGGSSQSINLDKLGGTGWEKTKKKVKGHLKDIASELLELYAKRAQLHRPAFEVSEELKSFSLSFPYEETEDQLHAIQDLTKDMLSTKPMDRLICGDVGFGKTEVAMRAAFLSAINKKQVAVLAPTTVLSFQHFETFKKRFHGWNFKIRELNRFVSSSDIKKTIQDLKTGDVDIVIGTHRILSKDIQFNKLGLLIVDEEHKFGVVHKERIKKLRNEVDTLTMSATPIPRTLNLSLMGVRDLSLINTAPIDRLPTRTFLTKWDDETIRKAIQGEIKRGGQIYFIHNRVQSIYGIADQIRTLVPEARIKVGHGQMDEDELEKTMIQFFNHEIDILVCTTIVESGMDIPRANTMFIDQAHMMGLSQLYQLRGRVGRSKQRAYCYLLIPKGKQLDKLAQERLKVIQENTALGSGIRIAQYDLELRGAGNILGDEQSGHINSVGYELYMDLLNEAVHQLKGEPIPEQIEPEINLKIPALIPESYISDIRLRLTYYKALAEISSSHELDQIESEFKDQFGEIPEPTLNLMGLMLIRASCKELGVKDLSAGFKNISLLFTDKTPLKPESVISLTMRQNKKYSLTPENKLIIRMNSITWPAVYEEINYLLKL